MEEVYIDGLPKGSEAHLSLDGSWITSRGVNGATCNAYHGEHAKSWVVLLKIRGRE